MLGHPVPCPRPGKPPSLFPDRHYTPPAARLEDYFTLLDALGLERAFAVHANTQGPCNDIYLDAVAQAPGRLLAVVRLDQTCTPETVRDLHRRGARGVRFAFNPQHGGRLDPSTVQHVMRCIRPWHWFVQLHFDGARLPELEEWIAGLDAPVLIDHLGRVSIADGLDSAPNGRCFGSRGSAMSGSSSPGSTGSARRARRSTPRSP